MIDRRNFIKAGAVTGIGIVAAPSLISGSEVAGGKRVGIIGLDTSHSIAFAKALNSEDAGNTYRGYKVVAAYPHGSLDIESSVERIAGYSEQVKEMGVKISGSIEEMLTMVDVVLLETNDEEAF